MRAAGCPSCGDIPSDHTDAAAWRLQDRGLITLYECGDHCHARRTAMGDIVLAACIEVRV